MCVKCCASCFQRHVLVVKGRRRGGTLPVQGAWPVRFSKRNCVHSFLEARACRLRLRTAEPRWRCCEWGNGVTSTAECQQCSERERGGVPVQSNKQRRRSGTRRISTRVHARTHSLFLFFLFIYFTITLYFLWGSARKVASGGRALVQPRGSQDSHHVKKFTWGKKTGWKLKGKGKRARRGVAANLHKCYCPPSPSLPPSLGSGRSGIFKTACACSFRSKTLHHILLCFESTRRVRCRFCLGVVDDPREGGGGVTAIMLLQHH